MGSPLAGEDQSEIVLENSPVSMPPEGGFDQEFRREIAQLVHDILKFAYINNKDAAVKEAYRRRLTVEQFVASLLADRIMDRVERECV
jgi:hypothetical protein